MNNHLYIMDADILDDEKIFRSQYENMSGRRRKKIDSFRFMKDKKLSLSAGILLREALLREGISSEELEFNKNEKPFLSGRNDIFFNLSHSGAIAVCAVSDRNVGADIEQKHHFEDSFLRYTYRPEEIEYIFANSEDPDILFTELWTIKESIMKFFGTGLSLEPDKIIVDMNSPVSASVQGFDASALRFTQYSLPGYALTVCSEYDIFSRQPEWIHI